MLLSYMGNLSFPDLLKNWLNYISSFSYTKLLHMKKHFSIAAGLALVIFFVASRTAKHPYGLQTGTPAIKSISAIAFGPDGILFIGDSKSASVFAVDTKDKTAVSNAANLEIKNIDQKIAAVLGTDVKNIRIQDIAVNPIS
jgi:hypothetical protein